MDIVTIISLSAIFLLGIGVISITAFYPPYLERKMNRELKEETD